MGTIIQGGGTPAAYLNEIWRSSIASKSESLECNLARVYASIRNQDEPTAIEYGLARNTGTIIRTAFKGKYKPVAKKKLPVPVSVPNRIPETTSYTPIPIPKTAPLPTHPPPKEQFKYTSRITPERLETILNNIPREFLKPQELDLFIYILGRNEQAISFTDDERGQFKKEYFPDYVMETVPHVPWRLPPIPIPKAVKPEMIEMLKSQVKAGTLEPSRSSYRSRVFVVAKPKGGWRVVHDLQPLNAVSIQDSMLPPNVHEFAESFVGYSVYGVMDLYSGYHQRALHRDSRPLTACQTESGNMQLTSLPMGYTNSMQEYQRTTVHTATHMMPDRAGVFVDDIGLKGPRTRYNNEPIPENPEIRQFIWEYAHTLDEMFATFITAGCTAAGKKLVLATPLVHIVGNVCSLEGRRPHHGVISKVLNWPTPQSTTDVRAFLGTAGVARNWIWQFAKIAKPLTLLTKIQPGEFQWNEAAEHAMNLLKQAITTVPALKTLDITLAKIPRESDRESDLGLVTIAVDSSQTAVGYVMYQTLEDGRHPLLYGSITWNDVESRYSQPKIELYGLFRTLKALRYDLWGIHFRIEVDAKFLKEMINTPGLPNAAMTRWISYIQLFDFELHHVPAERHAGPDGLSRRQRSADDSSDSDDDLQADESGQFITGMRPMELEDYIPLDLTPHEAKLLERSRIRLREWESPDPLSNWRKLVRHGHTTWPSAANEKLDLTHQGEKNAHASAERNIITLSTTTTAAEQNETSNEENDEDANNEDQKETRTRRERTRDGLLYWKQIEVYLNTLKVPKGINRKSFIQTTRRYFLYDDRIWRRRQGTPQLVIRDSDRRQELMKEAHDDSGHRGRDPTYKKLSDTYFWPNMMTDVALYCRTCRECQLRSTYRPKIQLNPTHVPTILRKFNIDVVDMGISSSGYRYIVDTRDDLTGWIEARMLRSKRAEIVAEFLYQDVICRFGCVPQVTSDNGGEFDGVFQSLTRRYGIPLIKTTPYHPQGNGMIERGHRTWINSIWRICGKKKHHWSQYFHAALWADRVTTRRTTGFSPYYLLYGKTPLFPFHITDQSWQLLDWHKINTTQDLLTTRTKQFAALSRDRRVAAQTNEEARVRAAQDFAKRNAQRLFIGTYPPETMVLIYQAKFDVSKKFGSKKYRERWAGPYRVHKRLPSGAYRLKELDGTLLKGSVAANRVKIFYARTGTPIKDRIVQLEDDSEDSDELGISVIVENDEEYVPSSATTYLKNPNWLSSYKAPEPNWQAIWDRWQSRKAINKQQDLDLQRHEEHNTCND